jgi:hypothetical protein
MTPDETVAFEEEKVREAEAARQTQSVERERRPEIGAGLFSSGSDTRSTDFLRESLSKTGPVAADDDEE